MASTLSKNLHSCFTMIKPQSPQSNLSPSNPKNHNTTLITNYNSLYDHTNACRVNKHREISFHESDSENQYFEHRKSSFCRSNEGYSRKCSNGCREINFCRSNEEYRVAEKSMGATNPSCPSSSSSTGTATSTSDEPDLSTIYTSKRFFFSSPGLSNSITESTKPTLLSSKTMKSIEHETTKTESLNDSVAVSTVSPDPYLDFRRSMEEMVVARRLVDAKDDWENLHELLLCYLKLNPKSTHKFIIWAFSDLVVSLLSSTKNGDGRRTLVADDGCEIPRHTM